MIPIDNIVAIRTHKGICALTTGDNIGAADPLNLDCNRTHNLDIISNSIRTRKNQAVAVVRYGDVSVVKAQRLNVSNRVLVTRGYVRDRDR